MSNMSILENQQKSNFEANTNTNLALFEIKKTIQF